MYNVGRRKATDPELEHANEHLVRGGRVQSLDQHFRVVGIESLREETFSCRRCGRCCSTQTIPVSSYEISRILRLLNGLTREQLEQHILDCLTNDRRLLEYRTQDLEKERNRLLNFWQPLYVDFFREATLVVTHMVHFDPAKGRCIFLNPIDNSCLVYVERPVVCELFPFFPDKHRRQVRVDTFCQAVGQGSEVNVDAILDKDKLLERLITEDARVVNEFASAEGFRHLDTKLLGRDNRPLSQMDESEIFKTTKEISRSYFESGAESISPMAREASHILRDPFSETGLIPKSALTDAFFRDWTQRFAENRATRQTPRYRRGTR